MKISKHNGFSLIELMVVISIIAVLSAISFFGIQGARESSRDARRKSDLEVIRSALEMFRSDCHTYLTSSGGSFVGTVGTSFTGSDGGCSPSNTYITEVPNDPVPGRVYWYISNGAAYTLCAGLESNTTTDTICTTAGATNCGSGVNCSYHKTNP